MRNRFESRAGHSREPSAGGCWVSQWWSTVGVLLSKRKEQTDANSCSMDSPNGIVDRNVHRTFIEVPEAKGTVVASAGWRGGVGTDWEGT